MNKKKTTIVLSSFHPLISRNLLQTGVLVQLTKEYSKVIICCPHYKKDFFEKNFASKQVIIVGINLKQSKRSERIFTQLGMSLLPTSTVRLNRRERLFLGEKKWTNNLGYCVFCLVQYVFAKRRWIRSLFQKISDRFWPANFYRDFILEHKPDLIFSSDIFHPEDIRLLASAKRMGITTAGMVRSWDNTTNKWVLPVIPQLILVNNQIIKSELINFHQIPPEKIKVVGLPQFDYYLNYYPKDPAYFYDRTGFSSQYPVIMFAPTGQKFVDDDWYLLQTLCDAIATGRIPDRPQILVRFPPGDNMELTQVNIPNNVKVFIDYPGVSFSQDKLKDKEIDLDAMYWLADCLYFSNLLVSVGSTLCIDISAFGKPVICPRLTVSGVDYFRSMVKMYDKYHYRYLFQSDGCFLVETEKDLINTVNHLLLHPKHNLSSRCKFLEEQIGSLDGRASERVVRVLTNF